MGSIAAKHDEAAFRAGDELAFALNYPFFGGAVIAGGNLFGAFTGLDPDQFFLITSDQIQHLVAVLAAQPEIKADVNVKTALKNYVRALRNTFHAQTAFDKRWVNSNWFPDCSYIENCKIVDCIPTTTSESLYGRTLRDLLGTRYLELNDKFENGKEVEIYRHVQSDGPTSKIVTVALGDGEVLTCYRMGKIRLELVETKEIVAGTQAERLDIMRARQMAAQTLVVPRPQQQATTCYRRQPPYKPYRPAKVEEGQPEFRTIFSPQMGG